MSKKLHARHDTIQKHWLYSALSNKNYSMISHNQENSHVFRHLFDFHLIDYDSNCINNVDYNFMDYLSIDDTNNDDNEAWPVGVSWILLLTILTMTGVSIIAVVAREGDIIQASLISLFLYYLLCSVSNT